MVFPLNSFFPQTVTAQPSCTDILSNPQCLQLNLRTRALQE